MTVGDSKIESGEFIRMYKKNMEPGKPVNINDYLQQYILFKLKVADALDKGYDTTTTFRTELNGYRSQLAQAYLTDTETKDKLLKKAWQRSLSEINGWHILITMPQDNTPEDTLKAWQKSSDIRERIVNGESFEQVARSTSDDQSVKVNGGNLGYFTVFQMVKSFEDAAYNLKTGAVSQPVRTPYGYHIIKVADKRPSKGKIKVAHIMKAAPPGMSELDESKAEQEIFDIYKKLQEKTPFGELAKEYSDHKESAVKGGELDWFGAGEIISDFSEAAFSIADTGNYSKPVRTIYGWHIIKLLDRKTPGTFEESKSFLESKINQSYLNSVSRKSFVEKLKKEYKFRLSQNVYNWFIANTDSLIIHGLKKYDPTALPSGNIYSFADQHTSTNQFADYIEKRASGIVTDDSSLFISLSIESILSDQIISYENSRLETKYPEFRYLMNEFHDGMLLFEISGEKVWNRITEDSIGLRSYYEDHKNTYLTPRSIEAKIYTLRSANGEKLLSEAYKKFSKKPDTDKQLLQKFNEGTDTLLIIKEGKWFKGDDRDIDGMQWNTGIQSINIQGFPSMVLVNKVLEPAPLKFEEVKGEMFTGYQEQLESEWIKQLKEKFSVKVNNSVFEEAENKLKNE